MHEPHHYLRSKLSFVKAENACFSNAMFPVYCNCVYKHSIKSFSSSFLDQCFGYGWILSRWENYEGCSYLGVPLLEASRETTGRARGCQSNLLLIMESGCCHGGDLPNHCGIWRWWWRWWRAGLLKPFSSLLFSFCSSPSLPNYCCTWRWWWRW
jgi:hypothetical protein